MSDIPVDFDLLEQLERIDRAVSETRKFVAEAPKLAAEASKLAPELFSRPGWPWPRYQAALATPLPALPQACGSPDSSNESRRRTRRLHIDYETDLSAWAEQQATLLRRRADGQHVNETAIDWLNIAEELEAVGRSERRELRRRMVRLLQHLLKWHYQAEHRSRSWQSTIRTQRREIKDVLADNPSLVPQLPDIAAAAYPTAKAEAQEETGLLNLPETSPFTVQQALDDDLPEA